MDVELTLPAAPVTLAPGVPSRVPVEVRNPGPDPVELRIFVARGRAAGWATVEPPTVALGPGATATVEVVLRTPDRQPPSSSLVPFTVHAEETATGEPGGFATALLTVALPIPVTGDLVARPGARHTYDLRLANDTAAAASLRIGATLDPPAGTVTADPEAVQLEPGVPVMVAVRAQPHKPFIGTPKQYAIVVEVRDAFDTGRPPYLTAVATGTRRPRVPSKVAGGGAIVLALGATAAIFFSGVRLPVPGRHPSTPSPVAQVTVGRPYALVDVFPHRGG